MALKKITTPKGSIINSGNGKAELTWNQNCGKKECSVQQKADVCRFGGTEKVQSEGSVPDWYVGKSGKLGTDVGSGEVDYIAPYAAMQYYGTADTRPYDANRGAHWFERMKVAEKEDILRGADKI